MESIIVPIHEVNNACKMSHLGNERQIVKIGLIQDNKLYRLGNSLEFPPNKPAKSVLVSLDITNSDDYKIISPEVSRDKFFLSSETIEIYKDFDIDLKEINNHSLWNFDII